MEIRDLYPNLSEKELEEAEETLTAYIEAVIHIYDRIRQDPEAYEQLKALTKDAENSTLSESERSKGKRS